MIWIGLTLGFVGSLHCLGMCGPLALGMSRFGGNTWWSSGLFALQYNFGRIVSYAVLGAFVGLIGEAILMSGIQKSFSIVAGILLIIMFLMSFDLEKLLFKSTNYKKIYQKVSNRISQALQKGARSHPVFVGMLNGLLPCGLVYLALAGSLASGGVLLSIAFMTAFGAGTLPAMIGVMIAGQRINQLSSIRSFLFRKAFPVLHLALGVFLIYRGIVVDMPEQLDFWTAIKHPVMCH